MVLVDVDADADANVHLVWPDVLQVLRLQTEY